LTKDIVLKFDQIVNSKNKLATTVLIN